MCQYKIETNTNKLILIQNHFPMYAWICECMLNELKFEISSRLILLNVKLIWKLHENLTGNVPENVLCCPLFAERDWNLFITENQCARDECDDGA